MTNAARRLAPARAALMTCLCLAGCAGTGAIDPSGHGPGSVRTPAGERLEPQAAMDRIAPGRSSKADVSAALGPAIAIPFDSGHEVWVYRWPGPDKTTRSASELVVLFGPSGVVRKVRVRPGYPPSD